MKYIARPIKSLVVVIKGPEASAGFIPIRSRTKGVTVPKKEAISTTLNKASDTTKASRMSWPTMVLNTNTRRDMANPLSKATKSPLSIRPRLNASSYSLPARDCTTIEDD